MRPSERIVDCDVAGGAPALAKQFHEITADRKMVVCQRCDRCGRVQFPPLMACSRCSSRDLAWVDAGEEGTVESWVTVSTANTTLGYSVPKRLIDSVPFTTVFVQPKAFEEVLRLPAFMAGVWPQGTGRGAVAKSA